ncbi:hypothetical protein ILYODFUR_035008 [Ilyodon furcidens]|uniref:Uncharacterized protein n=1 Tax=Ilyodon furcidens TaxID=33524 RepID=A0ABV0T6E6_9TELE
MLGHLSHFASSYCPQTELCSVHVPQLTHEHPFTPPCSSSSSPDVHVQRRLIIDLCWVCSNIRHGLRPRRGSFDKSQQIRTLIVSSALLRWLWRQRIRLHLEGTGINPTPVDLHEQQLSLEQHNQAHRITAMDHLQRTGALHQTYSKPSLLPVRSLNEIFIGESLSSRYFIRCPPHPAC